MQHSCRGSVGDLTVEPIETLEPWGCPYVVCQAAVGQGEDGLVMTLALVSFALVVGPGDGVGAQGGEGGQEHGALEPLVAAVGDVLAADR